MNSLKIGHELSQLIARRKTGEMGEFSYVCLKSGEERRGRGEIVELVKEKNEEGWNKVRELGGDGVTDNDFEARVRKLVAKLPWEKENARTTTVSEIKSKYSNTCNKQEIKQGNNVKNELVNSQETSDSMVEKESKLEHNQAHDARSSSEATNNWPVKEESKVKNESDDDKNKLVYSRTFKISKVEINQIVDECVNEKISPSSLAKKYEVNPDTIRSWIRKAGKQLPNPNEYKDTKNIHMNQNKKDETAETSDSMREKEYKLEHNQAHDARSSSEAANNWSVKEEKLKVENESDDDDDNDNYTGNPDAEIIAGMNYRYACLSVTCEKMFQTWKPCKKHMVQCSGIRSTKANHKELANKSFEKARAQGAVYQKGGLKKGLLPPKPGGPTEEDLVNAVETYYASLKNPDNRKHILAHLRKLYGKGEFRRFGFGTFIEFAKKHGLDVYNDEQNKMIKHRRQITIQILQKVIRKIRTPRGKLNFYCNDCGTDLNSNNETDQEMDKRREAREHIEYWHEGIYREVTKQIGYGKARTSDIIEDNLRGNFNFVNQQIHHQKQQHSQDRQHLSNSGNSSMKRVNESAKEDILSRLSEVFFRAENIYHCIICDNQPIGGSKKEAREHLSHNHTQEEMAMKEFIKQKYDTFVFNNFETFLRLVLHKVETF